MSIKSLEENKPLNRISFNKNVTSKEAKYIELLSSQNKEFCDDSVKSKTIKTLWLLKYDLFQSCQGIFDKIKLIALNNSKHFGLNIKYYFNNAEYIYNNNDNFNLIFSFSITLFINF
mmetsp:Transcript_104736/g.127928  ORF Transcript_104736/g.127928 Transcript_104736/m.127928 type:complete len:117 (-) Transcript_104736:243-593(-)